MRKIKLVVATISAIMLFSGCEKQEPRPCVKPQIQIADMTNQYPHCKGLNYDGKVSNVR